MVNIIKQEITIDEKLKKKLEMICYFSSATLKIINGSLRIVNNDSRQNER